MTQERMSAAQAWHVDLPWPDRDLHPNSRPHWRRKAAATKIARAAAGWAAKEAKLPRIEAASLNVTAIFYPPINRARDLDNMQASVKAYFDGIADVVGVDDSKWHVQSCWGLPRKGGNVRIVLEAA